MTVFFFSKVCERDGIFKNTVKKGSRRYFFYCDGIFADIVTVFCFSRGCANVTVFFRNLFRDGILCDGDTIFQILTVFLHRKRLSMFVVER